MEQIQVNLAFREFIGYELDEEIPDHSTLSKNRHGRFKGTSMFQEIFDEVVRQCIAKGLVAGKHLSFDGTTIHANASYESMVPRRVVEMSPAEYMQKVEQENPVAIEKGQEPQPVSDQKTAPKESGVASGSNEGVALEPESASPTDGTDTQQGSSVFTDGGKDRLSKPKGSGEKNNATHISRTDPEARIFTRPGQPKNWCGSNPGQR